MSVEKKELPEIGKDYRHYKGGKYNVLTMAKHSEIDEIKDIIGKLKEQFPGLVKNSEGAILLHKLEKIVSDDYVVYKSIHYGSVHARPLHMWFQRVSVPDGHGSKNVKRFEEVTKQENENSINKD